MSYKLAILTPEGRCFDGDIQSLVAPGLAGSFGVLANHAPMVAALRAGIVTVAVNGEPASIFVIGGGIIEVESDGVTLLADSAEKAASLAEAEQKLDALHAALKTPAQPPVEKVP